MKKFIVEMKEFIADFILPTVAILLGLILIVVIFIVAPAMSVQNYLDKQACIQIASANEVRYQYRFASGCLLNINGKMIPLDSYKNIDIKKDN